MYLRDVASVTSGYKDREAITRVDGKEAIELTAGTAAYFPLGWKGTWTVVEPVRKFYVVYK